ncbi:MAG: DNA-methyltransferase [bacterium]
MEKNNLFNACKIFTPKDLKDFSSKTNIPIDRLKSYNVSNTLPTGLDLEKITQYIDLNKLKIELGIFDNNLKEVIKNYFSDEKYQSIKSSASHQQERLNFQPNFETKLGKLYNEDCSEWLKSIQSDSVDMVFADPPFNLNKDYPSQINDNLTPDNYVKWCENWLFESCRVLKQGGSLFLWNLPKWNTQLSQYLSTMLTFKNWIAVDIKYGLPIQNRLYPSHYSLLYFVKGKANNHFSPDRLPMETCPSCYREIKDYGGYKSKMNPNGINLTDVWVDIPPVRHSKYKKRKGVNELSVKLMDRIIEMSTKENDLILDPFGGAGTTYIVSEIKKRRWLGTEIGPLDDIVNRFNYIHEDESYLNSIRENINCLFTEKVLNKRLDNNIWTDKSFQKT